MTRMVRVFVNGSGVDVPAGSSALDAVRAWNAGAAAEVASGSRVVTDSRGLPIDAATTMNAGSILRLVLNRAREAGEAAGDEES